MLGNADDIKDVLRRRPHDFVRDPTFQLTAVKASSAGEPTRAMHDVGLWHRVQCQQLNCGADLVHGSSRTVCGRRSALAETEESIHPCFQHEECHEHDPRFQFSQFVRPHPILTCRIVLPVIEERSQALLDKFTALGTVEVSSAKSNTSTRLFSALPNASTRRFACGFLVEPILCHVCGCSFLVPPYPLETDRRAIRVARC